MVTEIRADVVVIGGGLSGLAAAARLVLAGRRVVVLEQGAEVDYPCDTRLTTGVFHVCQRSPASEKSELAGAIDAATGGWAEPVLSEAVAGEAGRAVRWLADLGIEFARASEAPSHQFVLVPHGLKRTEPAVCGGDRLLRHLEGVITAHGGTLLRGHTARRLIEREGACAGVEGDAPEGRFRVSAGATILADGGYQSDRDLLAAHVTAAPERLLQRNARRANGTGLRMARMLGAAAASSFGFYGHLHPHEARARNSLWPYPWLDDLAAAGLLVGADGRRFADEGLGGVYLANRVAALADPLSSIVVFDAAIWDEAGRSRVMPANPHLELAGVSILRADTVAGLAEVAGLPAAVLEDEVSRHNHAVQWNTLRSLQPPRSSAAERPISVPSFMALPACAGITYAYGGISIDADARVLAERSRAIPGLYAAGATAGGIEGGPSAGYVGGLMIALVTGLRAAEHIVRNGSGKL